MAEQTGAMHGIKELKPEIEALFIEFDNSYLGL